MSRPQLISSQKGHMKRETRTQSLGRNAGMCTRKLYAGNRVHLVSRGASCPIHPSTPSHQFLSSSSHLSSAPSRFNVRSVAGLGWAGLLCPGCVSACVRLGWAERKGKEKGAHHITQSVASRTGMTQMSTNEGYDVARCG